MKKQESNLNHENNSSLKSDNRKCATCLYLMREKDGSEKEKCSRFVRFIDHVLNDNSRDCEYWQQA